MFNDNGSFLLALFEFFIFFAWIMCVFYVFADIFRSHDMGGGAKTIWCLFVIFVPFLGVLVYLIASGRTLGFLGEPTVNVLALNLDLDNRYPYRA